MHVRRLEPRPERLAVARVDRDEERALGTPRASSQAPTAATGQSGLPGSSCRRTVLDPRVPTDAASALLTQHPEMAAIFAKFADAR